MKMVFLRSVRRLIILALAFVVTAAMFAEFTGSGYVYAQDDKIDEFTTDDTVIGKEAEKDPVTEPEEKDLDEEAPVRKEVKKNKLKLNGFPEFTEEEIGSAAELAEGVSEICTISQDKPYYIFRHSFEEPGDYIFYSFKNDSDPEGQILKYNNGQYEELTNNDDDGGESNFLMKFTAEAGDTLYFVAKHYSDNDGTFYTRLEKASIDETPVIRLKKFVKKTGKATFEGTINGAVFDKLYVDGEETGLNISGESSFTKTINMKNYSVGYHTVTAELLHHSQKAVKYKVPTYIYATPSNKKNTLTSGQKYISLYNGNSYSKDSSCGLFFEYKAKGGSWKTVKTPVKPYETKKKSKLKSNKKYYVRTYYGKTFKYRGTKYTFKGKSLKKVSKTVSLKTGKKLPKIKSIKITKARVYQSNIIIYIGGAYGYRPIYTEFKVTVTLSKKPGTKGIYIGTKRLNGNKKKYTTTFTQSGNLIGEKLTVAVYSYQSTKYGGYSNIVRKKAKVRR